MEEVTPGPRRKGFSLRFKLNVGIILIIGIMFAGLNTFNVLRNRQSRRAEALQTNDTMARLIAGALLGELVDHDIRSVRVKTFLGNFLTAALTLNARNKELAFAVVLTEDNQVVAGRAKPELTVFKGDVVYPSSDQALQEIAKGEARLASNIYVKRFPLKVGDKGLVGKLLVGTSLARVEREAYNELLLNAAVFVVALTLLIIYSSLTLNAMVIGPLVQVVGAMQRVQAGSLSVEVPVKRRDEIGVLADTYNFMVRGLREQERLKDAFNRYVSRQVYEKFQAGEIALTGEMRQATVLFSDIRSFTTLSEELTPTEVVAMLNEYFNVMVEIVFKYDGFLNKFIGDALMAIYNVPLDQTQPELRAVQTAVEMMHRLNDLNDDRAKRGQFPVKIGIGINTGPVVAGNIGHEKRLEYTVIGDAVNLAQRIESQTKVAGATVLISETTYAAVAQYVQAEALPPVKVKGKAEPVALYAVSGVVGVGARSSPAPEPQAAST